MCQKGKWERYCETVEPFFWTFRLKLKRIPYAAIPIARVRTAMIEALPIVKRLCSHIPAVIPEHIEALRRGTLVFCWASEVL